MAFRGVSRSATYGRLVAMPLALAALGLLVPLVAGDAEPLATSAPPSPPGPSVGGSTAPTTAPTAPTAAGTATAEAPAADPSSAGAAATAGPRGEAPADRAAPRVRAAGAPLAASAPARRIGILLLDLGVVGRVGRNAGFTAEQQRAAWDAFIAERNRLGGVRGRRLVASYASYNILEPDTMHAACVALAEDADAFAVFDATGFHGPPVLCFTRDHGVPFLSNGATAFTRDVWAGSGTNLVTLAQAGVRILRNAVRDYDRGGVLRGMRIGIVEESTPGVGATIEAGLVDPLRALGHQVAHRSRLAGDTGTAASQVPVEVQQMRSKGVTTVLLAANNLNGTLFVQQADAQGYRPRYLLSDWWTGSTDNYAQNMPASFDGSLAITATRLGEARVGLPETSAQARCRGVYERATASRLDRTTPLYGLVTNQCALVDVFARAMEVVAPGASRAAVGAAVQGLGAVDAAPYGAVSFRPGKLDGADAVRTLRYDASCPCWKPVDAFRPA